jgi:hypothetical protein
VAQPQQFFLDGLKDLELRSHNCVAQGGICRENTFFFQQKLVVIFKAKDSRLYILEKYTFYSGKLVNSYMKYFITTIFKLKKCTNIAS